MEGREENVASPAWADVSFGLRNTIQNLSGSMQQPFQVSVFMTPGWSSINVGGDCVDATMFELSWIWIFLGYFMVPVVIHHHEKFREGSLKKTPRRFPKTPRRFPKTPRRIWKTPWRFFLGRPFTRHLSVFWEIELVKISF